MNRNLKQMCIDKERYRLETYLKKGLITEKDIVFLMSQKPSFSISFNDKKYSDKELYLKKIYRHPYLLCDQDISENIKKLLPYFINSLYVLELNELINKLNNHELTKEEYYFRLENLNFCMYESSEDGKNIKKNGKCVGINENVLILKG